MKNVSKLLRKRIGGICEPIRKVIEYKKPYYPAGTREHHISNSTYKLALHVLEEMDDLTDAIRRSFFVMAEDVSVFLESLYEQKHAFYFRRVREWHEFHQVNSCIYGSHVV